MRVIRITAVALIVVGCMFFITFQPAPMQAYPEYIVPGKAIGNFLLGMTREEIARSVGECTVTAQYNAAGEAIRLETHQGGPCWVGHSITVGYNNAEMRIVEAFGKPDAIYIQGNIGSVRYNKLGIEFLVLSAGGDFQILRIAIFKPQPTANSSENI